MRFIFGLSFDGRTWPDVLVDCSAVAGERWGGPLSLLHTLESQLGLSSPTEPVALRAAGLIASLDMDGAFWQASARVDPFATAMELIRWDAELRGHGWNGEHVSARLTQLADLMRTAAPGSERRFRCVLEALPDHRVDLGSIELAGCDRTTIPQLYRCLLDALEEKGCAVAERPTPVVDSQGDLADCLGDGFDPAGSGELQLIRPRGPLAAADAVAVWLAQLDDLSATVVIGGEEVLDAALRRHGLPVLACGHAPGGDALLQVLPLTMALVWRPPDPATALELLTLPETPVPGGVARRLDRALREWPAVGSGAWEEAMREGLASIDEHDRRKRVAERITALLHETVDGDECPLAAIERRLDALTVWLQGRKAASGSDEERWSAAVSQVAVFGRLCQATGAGALNRPLLERLLRHATEQACGAPGHEAEAGLIGVSEPGAIVGPVRRVVWWNFSERAAPGVRQMRLTPEERRELEARGIAPPDPGQQAEQLSAAWRHPLQFASEAVLLVCPEFGADGEPESPHPLWDEVAAGLDRAQESRLITDLPKDVHPRRAVPLLPQPAPRREWRLDRAELVRLPPRYSPTAVNKLIENPLYWILEYVGRLSRGRADGLPAGVLMIGRLAHEIIARMLSRRRDGERLAPDAAAAEAERLFVEEGPRLAAEFFVPGQEPQRAEIRRRTAAAMRDLFRHLDEAGATVIAVEEGREADVDGITLHGRPDLALERPDTLLDIKWGRADYRRKELSRGAGSQLAIYTRLVNPAASIGYYIVREQVLIVCGTGFANAQSVAGPSPAEVWTGTRAALEERLEQLRQGLVIDTCAPVDGDERSTETGLVDGKLVLVQDPTYSDFAWISDGGRTP